MATPLNREILSKPRFEKEFLPENLRLIIPSEKNWSIIIFLSFWLLWWAVVESIFSGIMVICFAQAIRSGFSEVASAGLSPVVLLILTAWVGLWTVVGCLAFYIWLWQIKGVEEVLISLDNICIKKITPFWKRSKSYVLQGIESLRVLSPQKSIWNTLIIGCGIISGGVIGFDYGENTVQFGIGLDESVANLIIEDINERFPSLFQKAL